MREFEIWTKQKKWLLADEEFSTDLTTLFDYWRNQLSMRLINIFDWKGLPFPKQELELGALMGGINFCAYHNRAVGVIAGSYSGSVYGVTRYPDMYTKVIYSMPKENGGSINGVREIGKNAVVLYNNSLSVGLEEHINRYASLLAHGDLTYKMCMVNARWQDAFAVQDSAAEESVKEYYKGKYTGKPRAILDKTLADIEGGTINLAQNRQIPDFMNILLSQNELLRNFYRDLGIRWTKEKRGNMITDEVESDVQLLSFNISDMLLKRQEFCDEYNRVFAGRAERISVVLNKAVQNTESAKAGSEGENEDNK